MVGWRWSTFWVLHEREARINQASIPEFILNGDKIDDAFHARLVAVLADRYDLGEEIGRGGMGVVYRAVDRRLQRTVAIKLLPPELAFRADIKSRFLREAVSAAQLSHPNIVPIYSVDELDGLVFFAMGFVDGENLGTLLGREGALPHARVRVIMQEVADGLAYAHERGVVHRDIKPDNIIIDRTTQRAMVTDFGIARAISDVGDTRLTATGVAIGTPAYMSPEQCAGDHEIDGRSDLYSLGAVGYQMICGRTPFEATSTPAMLIKQFSEIPRDVRVARPDTPADLANIVMRLLEKRPEDRFESGRVLVAALGGEIAVVGVQRRSEAAGSASSHASREERPNSTGWKPYSIDELTRRMREARDREAQQSSGSHGMQDVSGPRRERKLKFRDRSLADRVRIVRGEAWRVAGTSIFLMFINLITSRAFPAGGFFTGGFFPWFLFPTLGMSLGLWGKLSSLWAEGLRWNDVFGSNAKQIMSGGATRSAEPAAIAPPADPMWKHASRELLQSEYGPEVRQAINDHEGIRIQVERLSVADRGLIPDVLPTAKALFDRVVLLGGALVSLNRDLDANDVRLLDERIAAAELEQSPGAGVAGERKLGLLRKQRSSLQGLVDSRSQMHSQFESAVLMLRNLALDVLKLRSAGIQSVLNDVNGATQEARALVREIGHVLGAAEELRAMESQPRRETR